ncbi:hypothetical protein LIER_25174 [Lithospermum erythrorhizon]|uniref:Growth-regulating factor n=1 Tax=Lithospermum erythrorhizon TaxID=34254 RepID=A0AAV3R570_LITER
MMDSEPGRCRRTDGKKWRCYKSVVKDQKYCERHMHRGRQRSRKLVEGLEDVPKSDLLIANTNTLLLASANTCSTAKSYDSVKASIPTNSQHAPLASGTGKTTSSMVNVSSISRKKVTVNSHHSSAFPESFSSHYYQFKGNSDCKVEVYNPSSCYSTSASIKAAIACRHLHVEENGLGSSPPTSKVSVISSNNHFKEGYFCPATPANGFSQKSFQQYSPDGNHGNQTHDPNNGTETEHIRCKRTDGKQWRCSHDVVHGQKYCEKHMHRGAKKGTQISNPPIVAAASPSEGSDNPFFIAKRPNSHINLNMDPSHSIVACAMTVNGVTQSTSSSDATTISD